MITLGPLWTTFHLVMKAPGAAALIVVAVVAAERSLNYEAVAETYFPKSGPVISLTFDDGWKSIHEFALPVMNERNFKGTAYITTEFIASDSNYVTEEDILEYADSGWEIGAHTLRHENMTEISESDLLDNMILPKERLELLINNPVKSFSTPFGAYDDTVLEYTSAIYENHVNAWSDANGLNTFENFDVNMIHRLDTENSSVANICSAVKSLEGDVMYVLIFHKISELGEPYSVSVQEFEEILDCIEDSKNDVVSVSEGIEIMLERMKND